MPQEAMLFLVIIAAVVVIAIIIGAWMSKKSDPAETESTDVPEFENFDDLGDKTVDHLNGNTSVVYAPPPAQNLDAEIARKKAELERLERAIENANHPPKKQKKKGGCLSTLGFLFLIFCIIVSSGNNDKPKTSTNKMATVTRQPAVTATIEPDYYSMPIKQAAPLMASAVQTMDCTTRNVTVVDDLITIDVSLESGFTTKSMLNNAVAYSMKAFQTFFEHAATPQLYLKFWEPGRDKYGNLVDMCTITMRLERETYNKINWDYYNKNKYTQTQNYLNILDGHSLHNAYKEVLAQ